MNTTASAPEAPVVMGFAITPSQLAWIDAEAKRLAANARPNRSAVLRALIDRAIRESEGEAA